MEINLFLALSILLMVVLFPLFLTTSFAKRIIALFHTLLLIVTIILIQLRDYQSVWLDVVIVIVVVPMITALMFLYYYLKARLKV